MKNVTNISIISKIEPSKKEDNHEGFLYFKTTPLNIITNPFQATCVLNNNKKNLNKCVIKMGKSKKSRINTNYGANPALEEQITEGRVKKYKKGSKIRMRAEEEDVNITSKNYQ